MISSYKKFMEALKYAEKKHRGQKYGEKEYLYHLIDISSKALYMGYDDEIIISCVLHDVIEDTPTKRMDLEYKFGKTIADIVFNVTDEDGRTRSERKKLTYPKIKSDWRSAIVKIIDRVCNIEACIDDKRIDKYNMYKNEHKDFFNGIKNIDFPYAVSSAFKMLGKYYDLNQDKDFKDYINRLELKNKI